MSSEGRTKEMELIRAFLVRDLAEDDEEENSKSILYISGSPGTGKTALVNTILSSLETSSGQDVKKVFPQLHDLPGRRCRLGQAI